ncbi:inner centromere protein-related protein pic1 [Ceratobasidium sp. AG-Ba]|nr:inner centromere protein-related protein pic1 [Ceratobasidium sp. AG-Ba]
MASLGFAQWATGVRNRMANDPGRADFKDQVQCHGHLFLHEYLDDILNAPRPENVIEFAKTPGRNKTASKRTRATNASAQKVKPVMPISFPSDPVDKENISEPTPKTQSKGTSRFQHALFTAREATTEDAPHTRDSISRATFSRPGVPVFSPVAPTPTRAPLDDPTSPFRDADHPETASVSQQPQEKTIIPQQLFTTKLVIQPSSPVAPAAEEPSLAVDSVQVSETTGLAAPESQQAEVDLSIIQEDDEGHSIAAYEDAREDFTRPTSMVNEEEVDITDEPRVPEASAGAQPPISKVASSPPVATASSTVLPAKAVSSPAARPATPVQRLPSPPASEDTPAPTPKPGSPIKVVEPQPVPEPQFVEPVEVEQSASAPASESILAPEPEPVTVPAPVPTSTSQPTPPPEPTPAAQAPAVVPRSNSQVQPAQARPANPPRALGGGFSGPSLKELRREPSVSGATHRELRQSSWRKKPDSVAPAATATSVPAAPAEEANRLKRKSSVLTKPGTSKHQRKHSSSSSHSFSSSDNEQTELQVPIKDEDSTGGSSWNSGGSALDDLRSRLARLEKSTSGKTPAASRIWTTPLTDTVELPSDERRMSLSDLGPPKKPSLDNKPAEGETQDEDEVLNPLSLSTDALVANDSILSHRTTTPDNSPPPVRRVLPAPPVFAIPAELPAPVIAPTKTSSSDAVRAAAKADAARFFAGAKLAPAQSKTETQSTAVTEIDSVFESQGQSQSQWTQSTATSMFSAEGADLADVDDELDVEVDIDGDGEADEEAEDDTKASDRTSSRASSATQTRSAAKKGPVKSIQLAAAAAKKAAEEQDRKMTRMREMEERRQAAALRKTEEEKAKSNELEKKRKEREELAASKSVKPVVKKAQEDPNKKRKVEAEKKTTEAAKKPMATSVFKETAATKSRIAKPTPGPSTSASTSQPQLKSAMKSTTNPFAPPPSATKTIKHVGSSSSLKSGSAIGKKAKASISDAPGQALQAQMQARVQAQIKAAQKEPEIQSENIELPDINSEYSDSDDEDRGKDFPDWVQSPELMRALKDQETFNPDAIFGPIQPLKMGDLFKTGHSRFRKRTSSANWAGTDGITLEEEIEYARRMGYKN